MMSTGKNAKKPSAARRVLGDVLVVLALLLTASVCITMLRRIGAVVLKDDYRKVFRYQLFLCGALLLFTLDVRFGFFTALRPRALKAAGWAARVLAAALAAVVLVFGGKVIAGGLLNTAGTADCAVVLGMALEHGQPAPDLVRRLDTAQRFLEERPSATLILTGGNADASGRTEADVMRGILLERGIPADQMILEDQAVDTWANFRNAAQIVDPSRPVALITSNYHMDRAARIAASAGFSDCLRRPASSDFFAYGANVLSEVILTVNDLTIGR